MRSAAKACSAAARSLERACANGNERQAREDMALASLCGGLALANARLGAVHGIAGPSAGPSMRPTVRSAAGCCRMSRPANIAALRERSPGSPALGRFQEAARIFTGNPEAGAEDGAAWLRELCGRLGVPSLSAYGFSEEHGLDLIVQSMRSKQHARQPIDLTRPSCMRS